MRFAVEALPASHDLQLVDPDKIATSPALQISHWADLTVEYVPAGQLRQALLSAFEIFPASHVVQLVDPDKVATSPTLQISHWADAAAEKVPATQLEQFV